MISTQVADSIPTTITIILGVFFCVCLCVTCICICKRNLFVKLCGIHLFLGSMIDILGERERERGMNRD